MEDVNVGERLPDSVFLDTPAFPSALQVFASVGGLALLAEHLPLLYPEVTRQVTPPAGAADHHSTQSNIGSDWVTVESSDFSFEVCPHIFFSEFSFQTTIHATNLFPPATNSDFLSFKTVGDL